MHRKRKKFCEERERGLDQLSSLSLSCRRSEKRKEKKERGRPSQKGGRKGNGGVDLFLLFVARYRRRGEGRNNNEEKEKRKRRQAFATSFLSRCRRDQRRKENAFPGGRRDPVLSEPSLLRISTHRGKRRGGKKKKKKKAAWSPILITPQPVALTLAREGKNSRATQARRGCWAVSACGHLRFHVVQIRKGNRGT